MLNRLAFLSGSIACLVLLIGCGGGNSLITSTTKPADVYVAGYQSDASGKHTAIYWKNGIATTLPDNNQGSQAYAIAVSGQNVYVVGTVSNGTHSVATIWKNGSPVALTDGTINAYAGGVFVAGSDVYVAGYDGRGAEYWKNGVPVVLTDGSEQAASNAIFVSGSDVYAAGYEYQNTQISPTSSIVAPVATYWKNGTPVALANSSQPSVVWALFVSGSDVYASGYYQKDSSSAPTAAYWKNGALIPLTEATNTGARSIFVSGPDVYSVGDGNSVPQIAYYWKNATETPVSGAASASGVYFNQIVVSGGDVYIVGGEQGTNGIPVAAYWKNGTAIPLADGTTNAFGNGIAIVPPPQ